METIVIANEVTVEQQVSESKAAPVDAVRELNSFELTLVGGGTATTLYI